MPLTVTTAEEVTVSVTTVVTSCSVLEGRVEFVQGMEVPMGSALSMVVPAVPVDVGREVRLVLVKGRLDVAIPKPVEEDKPCVHGAFAVELALNQGPWPLELLIGSRDTLDKPEAEE